MLRRVAVTTIAIAVVSLLSTGCAKPIGAPHQQLRSIWRDYLQMPDQRALAIAGDPRRSLWVTSASGGHPTSSAATEDAIRQCLVRRRIQRLQEACVIYAVGDQIVWQGR